MLESLEAFFSDNALVLSILAGASLCLFIIVLIAVPIVLIRIDSDYFLAEQRSSATRRRYPALAPVIILLRNVVGVLLVLVGLIMLVTPGQGLLTILAGLMAMDFPGKFRLERRFIAWQPVYRGVNWLRRKFDREPLRIASPEK